MATPRPVPPATVMVGPSTSSSPAPPSQVLDGLRQLLPVLDGFNHRNKNQHRAARWWSSFNMLRRHAGKLMAELEDEEADKAKKKRRRPREGPSPAEQRARWLLDVLLPKCYLAFSQLAADNQFAPLGIVLLSGLAQVSSACRALAGPEDNSETDPQPARTSLSIDEGGAPKRTKGVDASVAPEDLGQVVSREDFGFEIEPASRVKAGKASKNASTKSDAASKGSQKDQPPKKKKKKAKKDEFDDLFSGLM